MITMRMSEEIGITIAQGFEGETVPAHTNKTHLSDEEGRRRTGRSSGWWPEVIEATMVEGLETQS
jgi:hypothetical protein